MHRTFSRRPSAATIDCARRILRRARWDGVRRRRPGAEQQRRLASGDQRVAEEGRSDQENEGALKGARGRGARRRARGRIGAAGPAGARVCWPRRCNRPRRASGATGPAGANRTAGPATACRGRSVRPATIRARRSPRWRPWHELANAVFGRRLDQLRRTPGAPWRMQRTRPASCHTEGNAHGRRRSAPRRSSRSPSVTGPHRTCSSRSSARAKRATSLQRGAVAIATAAPMDELRPRRLVFKAGA